MNGIGAGLNSFGPLVSFGLNPIFAITPTDGYLCEFEAPICTAWGLEASLCSEISMETPVCTSGDVISPVVLVWGVSVEIQTEVDL